MKGCDIIQLVIIYHCNTAR